jgi:DNA-binding transcriptional ArsR family regulator
MVAEDRIDLGAASIAAAIGEPARARILYSLMDGHVRTSTELAAIADVSPSTASAHLQRLTSERLITVMAQGKHRYYSLRGPEVARTLEGLNVLAGSAPTFVPNTPKVLRVARTCYDHLAGTTAVALRDRFMTIGWLTASSQEDGAYDITAKGAKALESLGIDLAAARTTRRRFAYACLDWSERRPHIGGAVGAALLQLLLHKRWVSQHADSRAISITSLGNRELQRRFGVSIEADDQS